MRIEDHLTNEQREKMNRIKKKKRKKKQEKVDWADIMGMNRDTYRRGKGGAIRRK